mgnify:CR=1 FL=1
MKIYSFEVVVELSNTHSPVIPLLDVVGKVIDSVSHKGATASYTGTILELIEIVKEALDSQPSISEVAKTLMTAWSAAR